ncbi:DUF2231 domain-containing protein [Yinghuangia seranimata]|uniref:DUF2231 domain-containing protein n=1 Tax=Yinghuangia seranimata TaxID=408067 RepID=UPI00248C58B3|nr:DUF2231 domain-containing protein [Yinghuangia seranimata]MDI2128059.1 hypothetical protein [Yinghuangia seranimata]
MFDTVFGLPVHILILHLTVVGLPVAALATIAVAVRPAWLPRFGWWVVALDAVLLVVVYVTRESGEKLAHRLWPNADDRPPAVRTHISRGEDLLWYAVALLVTAIVLVLVARERNRGAMFRRPFPPFLVPVAGVLAVAAAVLTIIQVIRVGDSGARAVWRPVVQSTNAVSAPVDRLLG